MDFTVLKSINKSIEQVLQNHKIGHHAANNAPCHLLIVYAVRDADNLHLSAGMPYRFQRVVAQKCVGTCAARRGLSVDLCNAENVPK